MRYDRMRPGQLRDAIARGLPFVLPIGVQEYHGEHLPLGMDLLAVTCALDRLEAEADIVILPPFAYGAASYAVDGPKAGTVHVDAGAILPFAQALFAGLLRVGLRNIHGVIHHQTENFAQGMPTDLAFRLAAKQAVFAQLEDTRGEGWWGGAAMAGYYDGPDDNPFNWISIHPLLPPGADYVFDHAGQGETALMLALAPDTVDPGQMVANQSWYTQTAPLGTREQGEAGVAIILAHLRRVMGLGPAAGASGGSI
jgi:creatinine amidohydrolase/Fe(II)-dependent formamide hydrolase-like protein